MQRLSMVRRRRARLASLCSNSHTVTEKTSVCRVSNRQNEAIRSLLARTVIGWGKAKMDRSLISGMPRDKYVERCKQRALDYLDRGDLHKAAALFVSDMNARPDCELPHHLAALGALLLMSDDALGWRALIAGLR